MDSNENDDDNIVKAKWISGILAALVVGGIGQAILTYTQLQVLGERTSSIQEDVKEVKQTTKENTKDRWTRQDHLNYANANDARIKVLEGKVVGIETEQARRSTSVWRVDKLASDLDSLRKTFESLKDHQREHAAQRGHHDVEEKIRTLESEILTLKAKITLLEKK